MVSNDNYKLFGHDVQIKSHRGNNGNFDMRNFNPFKSLVSPILIGGTAFGISKNKKQK